MNPLLSSLDPNPDPNALPTGGRGPGEGDPMAEGVVEILRGLVLSKTLTKAERLKKATLALDLLDDLVEPGVDGNQPRADQIQESARIRESRELTRWMESRLGAAAPRGTSRLTEAEQRAAPEVMRRIRAHDEQLVRESLRRKMFGRI